MRTAANPDQNRFNISLHSPTIVFLYLQTRYYVLSSTYPHFTLLGQSLGSLILAHDAFSMLVPDIFIDTMGYAFTLALSKFLFPETPTAAYVHYPTISTDMLGSLDAETGKGLNAGAGKGWRGRIKRTYWHMFAWMYSWAGGGINVVMTNSSWTQAHMRSLWGAKRAKRHRVVADVEVVFPPVAVEELEEAIVVNESSETKRERVLLYIAQFRPEKNHDLVMRAFSQMIHSSADEDVKNTAGSRLVLIGSVRNSEDATKVYDLRLLAHELKVKDKVEFICDASWPEILDWLRKSWIGVNGMWNEHFGIGVVEYQAAGLICIVNDSGGPKEDIVVEYDGGPTGTYTVFLYFALTIPFPKIQAVSNSVNLSLQTQDSTPTTPRISPPSSLERSPCHLATPWPCVSERDPRPSASLRKHLPRGGSSRWIYWSTCLRH